LAKREDTPLHVWIRKLLEEKPCSYEEIEEGLEGMKVTFKPGSLHTAMKRMRDWEVVKKLDDGRHADHDFILLEEEIEKRLKQSKLQVVNPHFRKRLAEALGKDPNNIEFRNAFAKIAKKLEMPWI